MSRYSSTIKRLIPSLIKKKIIEYILKSRYQTLIGRNCQISKDTIVEGHNAFQDGVCLSRSYIGRGTYIASGSRISNTSIGRYCSIGGKVQTGFGGHPSRGFVSTHPAFFSMQKQAGFTYVKHQLYEEHKFVDEQKKYYVTIGSDVWIGNNVLILDGVKIGDGAIIAAGSVVSKDVSPYSIVGGVPARIIRARFEQKQVNTLLQIKWWNWSMEKIESYASCFCDIDNFLRMTKDD